MLPVIILGGIYSGKLTPTESSAIAVVWSLIAGMLIYREIKIKDLYEIFIDSAKGASMVLFIIATSTAFAWLFTYAGISKALVDLVVGMHLSATAFCLVVAIILLIFGTFLEGIATCVLLVPVLWPIAQTLGVNIIHFGMIVCIANVVGTMTPRGRQYLLCLYRLQAEHGRHCQGPDPLLHRLCGRVLRRRAL